MIRLTEDTIIVRCIQKFTVPCTKCHIHFIKEKDEEKEEHEPFMKAEILACGPGVWNYDVKTREPLDFKVGDFVFMESGYITTVPEEFFGPDVFMCHAKKICWVFDEKHTG